MTEVGEKGESLIEIFWEVLRTMLSCRNYCRFPFLSIIPHFLAVIPVERWTTCSSRTGARSICQSRFVSPQIVKVVLAC